MRWLSAFETSSFFVDKHERSTLMKTKRLMNVVAVGISFVVMSIGIPSIARAADCGRGNPYSSNYVPCPGSGNPYSPEYRPPRGSGNPYSPAYAPPPGRGNPYSPGYIAPRYYDPRHD